MLLKRDDKDIAWISTIFIFCGAVIFLLIIAISQLKYNNSLEDYKKKLYNEEDSKSYLENIKEENKNLNMIVKDLEDKLEDYKTRLNESEQALKKSKSKSNGIINIYDALIKAELAKNKGDFIGAAEILRTMVNDSYLLKDGSELEKKIKEEVFGPAALYFYKEGYSKFINNSFEEAVELFEKSLYYLNRESFADDCLYYLGYSYYKIKNNDQAVSIFQRLLNDFPESNYIPQIKELINLTK